jgi:hypothetical protein
VRRAVLQEAVVVVVPALAPAPLRVIAGLIGKNRGFLRLEVDFPLGVVVALGLIQDVHGVRVGRVGSDVFPLRLYRR